MNNIINITITKETYPQLFKLKLDELMEQGAFNTKEEAEKWIETTPIALHLVYQKHSGLFAVEDEAVDFTTSPYDNTIDVNTLI